jgi:hypothetical protein
MSIIIEDANTLEFLTGGRKWTKIPGEGATFPTTRAAFAAAKEEPIGKFNIVLYFGDTEQFINMDHGSGQAG